MSQEVNPQSRSWSLGTCWLNATSLITYTGFLCSTLGLIKLSSNSPLGHSTRVGHQLAFAGLPLILFGMVFSMAYRSFLSRKGIQEERNYGGGAKSPSCGEESRNDLWFAMPLAFIGLVFFLTTACYATVAGKNAIIDGKSLSNANLAGGKSLHLAAVLALVVLAIAAGNALQEAKHLSAYNRESRTRYTAVPIAPSFFNQRGLFVTGLGVAAGGVMTAQGGVSAGMSNLIILAGLALMLAAILWQDAILGGEIAFNYRNIHEREITERDRLNSSGDRVQGAARVARAVGAAGASAIAGGMFCAKTIPTNFHSPAMIGLTVAAALILVGILTPLCVKAEAKAKGAVCLSCC